MKEPTTRSVITTPFSFLTSAAVKMNWASLDFEESHYWRSANNMNYALDFITQDIGGKDGKPRIVIDQNDVRKFKALYWDGGYIVQEMKFDDVLKAKVPASIGFAFNLEKKPQKTVIDGQEVTYLAWVAEFDSTKDKVLPASVEAREVMGFRFLTPRNPIKSKSGYIAPFVMVRKPVPLKEGWMGHDQDEVIKNCMFYKSVYNRYTNQIVQYPVTIDFDTYMSTLVSTEWHDKVTNLIWMNISRVWARIEGRVTDQLNAAGVSVQDVFAAVGEKGTGAIVKGSHGSPIDKEDKKGEGEEGEE